MNNHPSYKIHLQGFNNLSKLLNLSLYFFSYQDTLSLKKKYLTNLNNKYNAKYLSELLSRVALMIDANVLNIAVQDYEPHGASVAFLIAEQPIHHKNYDFSTGRSLVGHLDKSHITIHTYPEHNLFNGICTFRADIDLSTCGKISPLRVLNFLIDSFNPDLTIIDYQIRGFTRDICGKKYYMDHEIDSVQSYFSPDIKNCYKMFDVNFKKERMFRTKIIKKKLSEISCCKKDSAELILQQEILDVLNHVE